MPQKNKTYRYDFFEYPGSIYVDQSQSDANIISMVNNTVQFKFITAFEQNEHTEMIMSWGLFPDKKNDSVEFVYAAH